MLIQEWVLTLHASFEIERAMADLKAITRHDRYQASAGIQSAADEVAAMASAAGLSDVEIHQFPADGAQRWWSFRAPAAWTPCSAEVRLVAGTGGTHECLLSYPDQPYSLAANSAATPPGGITSHLVHWSSRPSARDALAGAVVLLGEQVPLSGHVLEVLSAGGARGVICVSRSAANDGGPKQVGRIELPPRSSLFAFSVTPHQLGVLARWRRAGGRVRVRVETVTSGTMPVVTACLPGTTDSEALLTAHLCHAMPGANDNASGAAALLGIGRVLADGPTGRPRRALRFLWGPEFVGLAAYLSQIVGNGAAPVPFAAVNLDMAGEDQHKCGGPLIVERAPDHLPSWLNAVIEECVRALPQAGRSYSGAVPCDTWTWRVTPFAGASDHSLLVDRGVGCPAVQLGHWPDRFNHSSEDTLDKVDPNELRRTACAAGAAVAAACYDSPHDAAELERVTLTWAAAYLLECLSPQRAPADRRLGWVDPLDPALAADRLAHRTDVAIGSVQALRAVRPGLPSRHREMTGWLRDLAAHLRTMTVHCGDGLVDQSARLAPSWPGPFNLRGLMQQADPADRRWLQQQLDASRGSAYATMLAIAHALDGQTGHLGVLRRAAFSSGLAVETSVGERFLDVLMQAGWARDVSS